MILGIIPDKGNRCPGPWQRIALWTAWLSYASALVCVVSLVRWVGPLGGNHPVIASLGAAAVFFVGCGLVLQVMGRADLPCLRFEREAQPPRAD